MKDIKGMKWNELTTKEQEELLVKATAIDARTGCIAKEDGDCTVDLFDTISVSGKLEDGEIKIAEDAIIYDSTEGVIR